MVMNNIFFGDGNYSKGHCSFTVTMTIHQKSHPKSATRTSEWAYCSFGRPVSSLHTPAWRNRCKVQFIDVSRTWKSYTRHKQPRGLFEKCATFVREWPLRFPASETSTTSTKRSASDSPLASSTPRSRLPTQKRPAVVRTDSDARIVPTARDPWPGDTVQTVTG